MDSQVVEAEAGPSSDVHQQVALKSHTMEPSTSFQFQGSVKNSIIGAKVVHQHNYHTTNINCSRNEAHDSDQRDSYEDISSFSTEMKQIVAKRAKEVAGVLMLPIELDLKIDNQQLEIKSGLTRSLPELDEKGHYHKRKDFEELFMRPCKGDLTLETLFEQAQQFATIEAKKKTKTEEAHAKYVSRHGSIVTVIGQAGIGKTTLARKMVELILEKKLFPNNEYIFFIPFREVDFSTECSLFDFIMTGCDLNLANSSKLLNSWVKGLQDNPNVIFIFDGLDEANSDRLSKKNYRMTRQTICKPDAFVRKIFRGETFPLAKKLVTSRPRQFFELDPSCRSHFPVDILGLNKISQEKLGKQICQGNFEKVQEFLVDHPDVSSSLYVPVKCIIIFAILSMAADKDQKTTVRSLTDIFVQALQHFVRSEHMRKESDELWKFAELAWKGFLQRKIIFTMSDIDNADISRDAFQAFLVTMTEKSICFSILEGDKRSSFTHLIWQELFAAINAMFLLLVDEFQSHLSKLTSPLWEVVSKFMFGLCHPSVKNKMVTILPAGVVRDLDVKRRKLHGLAVQLMKKVSEADPNDEEISSLLLQLCSWIREAGDPQLEAAVAQHFPAVITLQGSILPTDVSSLNYVMKRMKKHITLETTMGVKFVQDSLQRLLKELPKQIITMRRLDLSKSVIDNAKATSVADAVSNIKWLELRACKLGSRPLTTILRKITALEQPMKKLDLSYNTFGVRASALLADAVPTIRDLELRSCQLSGSTMMTISQKILILRQPMECLDLSRNAIDDTSAASLAEAVPNIKRLKLHECELSSYGITTISKRIALLTQPMEKLNLTGNTIDDDAASCLADAVAKIKYLRAVNCKLSGYAKYDIRRQCSLHNCKLSC